MTEFDEDFVIPEDISEQTKTFPMTASRELAFYTSESSFDVPQDHSEGIAMNLEMRGNDASYQDALKRFADIQSFQNRDSVIDIMNDPTVSQDTKVNVVRQFNSGELTSNNLKDQFIQNSVTKDVPAFKQEDIPLSGQDIEAQELFLDRIAENINISEDIQRDITGYSSSFNTDTTTSVLGLATEVLSVLDLHHLKSALIANELGVSVNSKDFFNDESFLGIDLTPPDNPDLVFELLKSTKDFFQNASSLFDGALFDIPRNFIFGGTLNRKVNEYYQTSTPDRKKDILKTIVDKLEEIPGTDIQRSFVFRELIEEGLSSTEANLSDLFGLIGAAAAAKAVVSPLKSVKWFTTYDGTGFPAFISNTKVEIKDSSKGIDTIDPDVIRKTEKPTGAGEVNATDNTIVSTEDLGDVSPVKPPEIDKIFVQTQKSIDAKSSIINVNISNVDVLEDVKAADKAFVKASTIEVPEVRIDAKGKVTFIEGQDTYTVMKQRGIKDIPLSMDLQSVVNAQKHGFISRIPPKDTNLDTAEISRYARLSVPPASPAGVVGKTNPVEAANRYTETLLDATDSTARHIGASKAQIISDSALPKLDVALEETFPDIADNLRKLDETFTKIIKNPEATQLEEKVAKQREVEIEKYLRVLKGNTTGKYNQANSTVHIGRGGAEGIATFGRNDNYGFATQEEAQKVLKNLNAGEIKHPSRIVERNGSFFVEQNWKYSFDHIDRWMFDIHSMDSSILGIDTSFITRSNIGKWLFVNTMKGNPDLAKQGFLSELKANTNESKFFGLIRKEILETPHRKELQRVMDKTQEEQKWFDLTELRDANPHLNRKQLESLSNAYYSYKRGSEYAYELANKLHRSELEAKGFGGLYNKETGDILAHGKVTDTRPDEVFSFSTNKGIATPEAASGRRVIELSEPVNIDGRVYKHALLDETLNLGVLPARTLPKIQGWIPRRNTENYYIDFTPNKVIVDGREVTNADELKQFRRTVGAGTTFKDAEEFSTQLVKDHKGGTLTVREAAENAGDTGLEDYQLYKDVVRNNKQRGDRLRTINGFSKLEDPLEAFASTVRSLTRLNAWQPFKQDFEKSFSKFADAFIPSKDGQKLFPNDVRELKLPQGSSREEVKRFKVAQRLLEQYKEMQYTQTAGDRAWRAVFNNIANVLEDVGWAKTDRIGALKSANTFFRNVSEVSRDVANQGNLIVRIPKSFATNLFINLNPPRQWLIQPQQLLELNAIEPSYAKKSPTQVPAIITAILSRAPHMKKYDQATYDAAKKTSFMDSKDFDDTVDAIYDSGLPQSVDLNQMLYGTWENAKFTIDPTGTQQITNVVTNIVKAPGKVGKAIGFTPAELANNIGTWLFARERWKKQNPGADWNTPANIARITADSWDINHAMIGRAGALPFQNGALGVLFQFVAIQQKGFLQLLSSKTLTKEERVKLAAARMVLYGGYGVPLGAVGIHYIDQYVNENATQETQQLYSNNKGGIVDALGNTLLDVMFADEGTEWDVVGDTFVGKRKGKSDITFSKVLSPVPEGKSIGEAFPITNMLIELSNYTDNAKQNPRFPGIQAVGTFSEAVSDIKALWRADTIDTGEKLVLAAKGIAETASLYNNYGKAVTMKQYRDKSSKLGNFYGLQVTDGEILAQKMGFTTRDEELLWANAKIVKERQQHISNVSNEVFRRFQKMERFLGEEEFEPAKARLNEMMELSVESEDVEEVRLLVDKKILDGIKAGTIKQGIYESIFNIRKDVNNKKTRELISNIQQSALTNEGDARVVDMLKRAKLIEE